MAADRWRVVDLGTKRGGALGAFSKHYLEYFPDDDDKTRIAPSDCLGIDANPASEEIEKRGYAFLHADVADVAVEYPRADYYLAWNFLEHLPSRGDSRVVLARMLAAARRGVSLLMPSFEREPQLDDAGLAFAWTRWPGHTSHVTLRDVLDVVERGGWYATVVLHGFVGGSSDERVVPAASALTGAKYAPEMGPKAPVAFVPPVAYGSHVIIKRTPSPCDLDAFTQKVRDAEPFTLVKFGDGEFICMSERWGRAEWGLKPVNCDGDPYSSEAGRKLVEAYGFFCRSPRAYIEEFPDTHPGIPASARDLMARLYNAHGRPESRQRPVVRNLLFFTRPEHKRQDKATLDGLLRFYSALRRDERRKVFVGPERLAAAAALLRADEHVIVPPTDAFSQYDVLRARLTGLSAGTVVLFAAGKVAKVLARDVMEAGPVTCVDLGSALDAYCGFQSRQYHPAPDVAREFFSRIL